jgi:succinate dehydrogenase / fumarate reductase, cytochrome b subunit
MTTSAITFYGTTIGKKVAMAVSGLVVVGWLVLHMLGNITIFAGREAVNKYAAILADNPPLLWGQRVVTLVAIAVHIHAAFSLVTRNAGARPVAYKQRKDLATNYAALTMRYGGFTLLAYILYHLAHLTLGVSGNPFVKGDVYNNLVLGFQNPAVAGFYVLAQCALAMHLFHGIWSLTQTLGMEHPKYNALRKQAAAGLTAVIVGGFLAIPIAVQAGVLQPDLADSNALEIATDGEGETETEEGSEP